MSVVAIGFFDGVHLGHQKILAGADVAVTFKNHPATVLNPAKAPKLIMSFDDRLEAIKACGVQNILALDFTPELASLTPEQFLQTLLRDLRASSEPELAAPVDAIVPIASDGIDPSLSDAFETNASTTFHAFETNASTGTRDYISFRCGANWRFGKNAAGDPEWLRNHGIKVEVIEAAVYDNAPVSSTRIRECLVRGEISAANAMLGRRYKVRGEWVKGKGEGKNLGYPTVNLRLNLQSSIFNLQYSLVELPFGVYQVSVEGKKAIANYGFAPTFGDRAWKEPMLEIHFLESPLSTSTVNLKPEFSVEFVKFIRPERKFDSVESLKTQIAADIAALI